MGKASRRREQQPAAAPPSAAPAAPAQPARTAPPAPRPAHWLQLDTWEKVVLMFLCLTCTMKFLGDYIPGVKVLMEGELMGYLGSAVSVFGMAGLSYSFFAPADDQPPDAAGQDPPEGGGGGGGVGGRKKAKNRGRRRDKAA